MSKRIKTTDTGFNILESTIEVININGIQFEHNNLEFDVDVYLGNDRTDKEYYDSFEIGDNEDLKIACINWYFNNVEIVKDIVIKEDKEHEQN
ncbi:MULTISPECIES: hypothetical protein [Clostridium]|uniref:Phage protein n=1 Tax=Clostridium carnis TaxID=1530 RepID=A0ABY6STA6_9CLOT|nr:hypothetical protein [Clostridium carnis]CAI3662440.1 conserved hypothetical protein [Clostridium neonatale]CAI3662932.1 conserved hypothetical protein [Clostridium neonatale]CAI3683280.1 conserved hypothetical protein [Clostridium neonatale]CAI3694690.1 conserved hypothetical protein [Clostridium neonatale]CAI3707135.1 conserved hypothetical protein [Clostridium neonatale]